MQGRVENGWVPFSTSCILQLVMFVAAIKLRPRVADESLTGMDATMLNLDRVLKQSTPAHGHVVGVMYVEACPSKAEAVEGLQDLVNNYKRFRSSGVFTESCLDTTYTEITDMNVGKHVGEWTVASSADVESTVEELANTGLDMQRPLWNIDLISNKSGDSAIVLRCNHCIADGLRLVQGVGSFLKFESGAPAEVELLKRMSAGKRAVGKGRSIVAMAMQILSDLKIVADLPNLPAETKTCLHIPKQIFAVANRRVIARSSVPFAAIKTIKQACPKGTTINDVVLTSFCGAVRRYMEASEDPACEDPNLLMRAFCAVALPDQAKRNKGDELYNNFVMPSFDLAVSQTSRSARLAATTATMQSVKKSLSGPITMAINNMLTRLGAERFAGDTTLDAFANHSFVYSCVPAYEKPVYVFGNKHVVKAMHAYYPNMISQVLCVTYCDTLSFSLITDKTVCTKPALLAQLFVEEVTEWAEEGSEGGGE